MRAAGVCVTPLALLFLCGCPPQPVDPGGAGGVGIEVQEYVASADFATSVALAPDGRLFYTEKETGRVRVVTAEGQLLGEPFATVPVVSNAERGLLGIALHPDFEQNGFVYVYYTRSATGVNTSNSANALDNRVVQFTAAGNVSSGVESLIISLPATPGGNHQGGHLTFGPDGKLYVSIGDLTQEQNSQSAGARAGRILRLNEDGTTPDDNPFGADDPTYALGLRNSFDLSFDPVSGVLWATENGTFNHDEVNRIVPAGNYGWPLVQGSVAPPPAVAVGAYQNPIIDYTDGSVVPTGIAFAPDDTFGEASERQLFVAQYRTGRILRYSLNEARDGVVEESVFAQGIPGGLTDLEFGADGYLYAATGTQVLRIIPAGQ